MDEPLLFLSLWTSALTLVTHLFGTVSSLIGIKKKKQLFMYLLTEQESSYHCRVQIAKIGALAACGEEAVHKQHSPAHLCTRSGITRKASLPSPEMTATALNAWREEVIVFAMLDFRLGEKIWLPSLS